MRPDVTLKSAKAVFAKTLSDMMLDWGVSFDNLSLTELEQLIDQCVAEHFRPIYDEYLALADQMILGSETDESRQSVTRAMLRMQMRESSWRT